MRFVAGAVALALLTGSAAAADLPVKAPVMTPAPAYNWTGGYIGAFVGYHSGNPEIFNCVGICPIGPEFKGGFAGIQGGYDWHLPNNVVLGLFGVLPLWAPDTTISPLPGINFDADTKFVFYVGGRAGYAFNNVLPYIHGGYTRAKIEAVSSFNGIVNKQTHDGGAVGAGVEWAFLRNWSLDARYTYMSYGKEDYNFGGGIVQWNEDSHNVSLAINYRFGR